ncbi:hypothetical protein CLV78_10633 [Aliiruegeria haliotis]|uniref:Uncharacterized protein n=2 Tax=Aliiruegeria haliotis TaxID=1280846 RepID=A0A2T0RN08_9RHOB|nr:hypothetical protein CLV78_10633 [Aliiruegeria haliotis]
MIKSIQNELSNLAARLGPAPLRPRPADEAQDIYAEIRFARNRRALALAAVCYWCGFHPTDALEHEASWS